MFHVEHNKPHYDKIEIYFSGPYFPVVFNDGRGT